MDAGWLAQAPVAVVATDAAWRVVAVSAELTRLTGWHLEDLQGRSFATLLTRSAQLLHQTALAPRLAHDGHVGEVSLRLRLATGGELPVLLAVRTAVGLDGVAHLSALLPQGARHEHEQGLRTARRRAEAAQARASALHAIVRELAAASSRSAVDDALARHLHRLGFPGATVRHDAPGPPGADVVRHVLGDGLATVDLPARRRASGIEDEDAAEQLDALLTGAGESLRRLASLERLRARATTDPLTGLDNRRALRVSLERRVASRRRRPGPLTVAVLDLDGFKRINDTRGHAAGDRVLQAVAEQLRGVVRPDNDVARHGGDEFVVVSAGLDSDEAVARFADRLRLAARQADPELDASVGVLHHPPEVPPGAPEELLQRADGLMYDAKRRGGRVARALAVGDGQIRMRPRVVDRDR